MRAREIDITTANHLEQLEAECNAALETTRNWRRQQKVRESRDAAVVYGVLVDKLIKARADKREQEVHAQKIAGQTGRELGEFMEAAFMLFAELLGIPDRVVREIAAQLVRQKVAGEELVIDSEQAARLQAGLLSLWRDEIATEIEWEAAQSEAAQRRREAVSGLSSARTQTGQGSGYGGRKSLSRTPEPERVTPQPQTPEPKETILLGKERQTLTEAELAAREAHIHNNDEYWKRW